MEKVRHPFHDQQIRVKGTPQSFESFRRQKITAAVLESCHCADYTLLELSILSAFEEGGVCQFLLFRVLTYHGDTTSGIGGKKGKAPVTRSDSRLPIWGFPCLSLGQWASPLTRTGVYAGLAHRPPPSPFSLIACPQGQLLYIGSSSPQLTIDPSNYAKLRE